MRPAMQMPLRREQRAFLPSNACAPVAILRTMQADAFPAMLGLINLLRDRMSALRALLEQTRPLAQPRLSNVLALSTRPALPVVPVLQQVAQPVNISKLRTQMNPIFALRVLPARLRMELLQVRGHAADALRTLVTLS